MNNRQIVELVSVFAVVASLVFVGLQLMQDRRVAIAGQHHSRAQILIERAMSQLESEGYIQETATQWESGQFPDWWSSEVERWMEENDLPMTYAVRESLNGRIDAILFDNNYFQYQQGLVDENSWAGMNEGAKASLSLPIRKRILLTQENLRPQTKDLISSLNENIGNN